MSTSRFPITSRYNDVQIAELTTPTGDKIPYVRRRFVPPSSAFAQIEEHRVMQGERLDLIAAHYLGDPLMFWIICDANDALRPEDLTEEPGRTLRITLPAGVPGVPSA